jgi:hypothetical protein
MPVTFDQYAPGGVFAQLAASVTGATGPTGPTVPGPTGSSVAGPTGPTGIVSPVRRDRQARPARNRSRWHDGRDLVGHDDLPDARLLKCKA